MLCNLHNNLAKTEQSLLCMILQFWMCRASWHIVLEKFPVILKSLWLGRLGLKDIVFAFLSERYGHGPFDMSKCLEGSLWTSNSWLIFRSRMKAHSVFATAVFTLLWLTKLSIYPKGTSSPWIYNPQWRWLSIYFRCFFHFLVGFWLVLSGPWHKDSPLTAQA